MAGLVLVLVAQGRWVLGEEPHPDLAGVRGTRRPRRPDQSITWAEPRSAYSHSQGPDDRERSTGHPLDRPSDISKCPLISLIS